MATNNRPGRGVICSGNLVYDTLVKPVRDLHWGSTTFVDTIEYHAGGNGASTARALGILGTPVKLLGAIGDDPQGRFLLERIQSAGVDVSGVETVARPTSATVAIVSPEGERKFFHLIGASLDALRGGISFTPELFLGMAPLSYGEHVCASAIAACRTNDARKCPGRRTDHVARYQLGSARYMDARSRAVSSIP
ncbi:MAG: carbohydrate kinase family protein [Acidobacteriaceae bacterium]|nr:carbohydrate kinase family protein [Acidobacteriaceae bacterium]